MSMPRRSLLNAFIPAHNRLPAAGSGLWWPMHGSPATAIYDTTAMDEIEVAGSASGTAWEDAPGRYTFPADNGGTNKICLTATHSDEDDHLNDVFGLAFAVGKELVICCEAVFIEHADANGHLWYYGANGATGTDINTGGYGLYISATEALSFSARGVGASSGTNTALTPVSGATFSTLKNEGMFQVVCSIHMTSLMAGTVTVNLGNTTVGSGVYTGEIDFSAGGATAATDRLNLAAANIMGFTVGARNTAGMSHEQYWGRGATNTGSIGNVAARMFATYSESRSADTLAAMLTHPSEFPPTLLD